MLVPTPIRYTASMSTQSVSDFDGPAAYQITVRGAISPDWLVCLEGMVMNRLTLDDGTVLTILVGELTDQAALSGVLNTLYDLRLPLIAVTKLPVITTPPES